MANEKRLIEKQTVVKLLRGKCVAKYPSTFLMGLLASATEIEQLPEVDAVEVVRCKDCKYASCNPVKLTYGCQHPSGLRGFLHEGFYFCSYGERKDNGN